MNYMTTQLGRPVLIDNWKAFQGDGVLKFLRDVGAPAHLQQISNAGPLGVKEAKDVCEYLKEQLLVESMFPIELPPAERMAEGFYYEITDAGKRFVAACLDEHFLLAEQIIHEAKMTKTMKEAQADIVKKLDAMSKHFDERGIPGNLVPISKDLREAILRDLKVPKKDWKKFDVCADVRLRRALRT